MELFVKVERTGVITSGTRNDGTTWTRTPVVFKEVSGLYPQSLVLDLYENTEGLKKLGLTIGNVGTLTFSVSIREYNGRIFNDLRFHGFAPFEKTAEQTTQPVVAATAPVQTDAKQVTEVADVAKAPEAEKDGDLPF